jgi:hypothetical protein
MTGMSGAQANQAKKQMKKATQVRWKARICGVLKENSCIELALAMNRSRKKERRPLPAKHVMRVRVQRTPLSVKL